MSRYGNSKNKLKKVLEQQKKKRETYKYTSMKRMLYKKRWKTLKKNRKRQKAEKLE